MSRPLMKLSDNDFAGLFQQLGPRALAQRYECSEQAVQQRARGTEARLGVQLTGPRPNPQPLSPSEPHLEIGCDDGVALVGGDGHYWPGSTATAHRALVAFASELKPKVLVFNGDALDAPSISRHPPIGWENLPSLEDELAEVQERLAELQTAAGRKCRFIWPLGNHDARFNTRLAALTPEYRGVPGTRLVHHFPLWEPCWSTEIGGKHGAIVKHRFKGGIHAPHTNTLWSGRTIITGHLHSLKVTPLTDYNGTRWGVDGGCLANPKGPQFAYAEANPHNHRAGFIVLTFRDGELLWPEIVSVHNEAEGLINWRGELYNV